MRKTTPPETMAAARKQIQQLKNRLRTLEIRHAHVSGELQRLREENRRLERLGFLDPLTEAYNLRGFLSQAEEARVYASRYGCGYAIVRIDLDKFKPVNEEFGHKVGDRFLRTVVRILRRAVRSLDSVCRVGGDEFTLVLFAINDETEVALIVDRIRRAFQEAHFTASKKTVRVLASFGVAVDGGHMSPDALDHIADTRQGIAKGRGRETGEECPVNFS